MNERELSRHDRELLDRIDEVVAGGDGEQADAELLHSFCAVVARAAPQPDEGYRTQLLERLKRDLYQESDSAQQARLGATKAQSAHQAQKLQSAPRATSGQLRRSMAAWRGQWAGRLASVTLGLAGAGLVVALFLGLVFMFKTRTDISGANMIATAVAGLAAHGSPTVVQAVPPAPDSLRLASSLVQLRTLDTGQVSMMAWSPDGHTLAVADASTLAFWDASAGRFLRNFPVDGIGINSMAWSPDGTGLAVSREGDLAAILDPITGQVIASLADPIIGGEPNGGVERVTQIVWSPKGNIIATLATSGDQLGQSSIKLWDSHSANLMRTISDVDVKPETQLAWSPDGQTLIFSSGYFILLLDPTTGKISALTEDVAPTLTPVPPPVGTLDVKLLLTPSSTPIPTSAPDYARTNISGMAWSPDGRTIATIGDNVIKLWPTTGKPPRVLIVDTSDYMPFSHAIGWSADGNLIASALVRASKNYELYDGTIKLWDSTSGKELRTLATITKDNLNRRPTQAFLTPMAWSPTEPVLAFAAGEKVELWGVRMGPSPTATDTPPSAATQQPCGGWSIVDSPNVDVGNELQAVAAVSNDDVWAVGTHYTGTTKFSDTRGVPGVRQTLIEHWDGKSWKVIPSPNVGTHNNRLLGVAAVSRDDVWAVGYYGDDSAQIDSDFSSTLPAQTLVLHWDGKSWKIVTSPDIGQESNRLREVAVVSANDTWAVGVYGGNSKSDASKTLVLHWDGKAWTQVPSPNPGAYNNELTGLAAVSGDDVWVSGTYLASDPNQGPVESSGQARLPGQVESTPFIFHWDSQAWAEVAIPSGMNYVSKLAAASKDSAWALGGYFGEGSSKTQMLYWDGARWAKVALPISQLPEESQGLYRLSSVVAISKDDAWGVGSYITHRPGGSDADNSLTLHWDGKSWMIVPSPNRQTEAKDINGAPYKQQLGELNSIAATPGGELWVVGTSRVIDDQSLTFVMHYTSAGCPTPPGKSVNTPLPAATTQGLPTAAPRGTVNPPAAQSPVAADCGLIWRVVSDQEWGPLNAVTAISANDVWAVGHTNDNPAKTLITHWDGKSWSRVPSPNVDSVDNELHAVAALSPNDVWVVGSDGIRPGKTLTMHWDGNTWKVVSSPDAGSEDNDLQSITAISHDDVWAVGYYSETCQDAPPCPTRTLIMHWDANAWKVVTTPKVSNESSALKAVAASSQNDIWAVGYYAAWDTGINTFKNRTLILHWNGQVWSQVSSPNVGWNNWLAAVDAISRDDVWVVGDHNAPDPESDYTLLLHWDGKAWNVVPDATLGGGNGSGLTGVVALSANDVWATGNPSGMFAEHWDGKTWRMASTPRDAYGEYMDGMLLGLAAVSPTELWAVGGPTFRSNQKGLSVIVRYGNVPCVTGTPAALPTKTPRPSATQSFTITPIPTSTPTITATWLQGRPTPKPVCGTWSVASYPEFGRESRIRRFLLIAANDIWAVGVADGKTLTAHWDGKKWTRIASPHPDRAGDSDLYAVAGTAANDVWAVGRYSDYYDGDESLSLVLRWDGKTWTQVPSPRAGPATYDYLTAVVALSKNDAWAMGNYTDGSVYNGKTLLLHWDGKTWTHAPSPTGEQDKNVTYNGISAVSGDDIWAVGATGGQEFALALHWDGKAWTRNTSIAGSGLADVVALSKNNVWAVGGAAIIHWDGRSWATVHDPALDTTGFDLRAIAAPTKVDDIWAIGDSDGSDGSRIGARALVAHWDGTQWSAIVGPNSKRGPTNMSESIAATSNDVWVADNSYSQVSIARFAARSCGVPMINRP